jgi:hypothetical protein
MSLNSLSSHPDYGRHLVDTLIVLKTKRRMVGDIRSDFMSMLFPRVMKRSASGFAEDDIA